MVSGGKKICRIKFYRCGSCENDLSLVFRRVKAGKRRFPALAALIQHHRLGNLLYDTGYSEAVYHNGLLSRLYCRMNPTFCDPGDQISDKLRGDGIPVESIRAVILSHAHPDHMGGLSLLKNYRLIATRETFAVMSRPTPRDLVFQNMLPGADIPRHALKRQVRDHFLCRYFGPVYDILGDRSLWGVDLAGHSAGQLGLFFPEWNLLLGADAAWGSDLLVHAPHMRPPARLIQKDYLAYCLTARRLTAFRQEHGEVRILFSHEEVKEGVYV